MVKKSSFTINGRNYRAPWIIAKFAPYVIGVGMVSLPIMTAASVYVIAWFLQ